MLQWIELDEQHTADSKVP